MYICPSFRSGIFQLVLERLTGVTMIYRYVEQRKVKDASELLCTTFLKVINVTVIAGN